MFDANKFKKSVKEWIRNTPDGTIADLTDFCEDQIPPANFASYQWLVEQTISWYGHILSHREAAAAGKNMFDDDEMSATA